jgi:rhodanese-related sulfurtransferase
MAITKEMVKDKIRETNVLLLNVLPEDDFLKLHIKGSHSMPLTQDREAFVADVETRYGKGMFLITYGEDVVCAAGMNAAKILKKNGFKADFYPGGLREWDEAGLPTEGIRPGTTTPSRRFSSRESSR